MRAPLLKKKKEKYRANSLGQGTSCKVYRRIVPAATNAVSKAIPITTTAIANTIITSTSSPSIKTASTIIILHDDKTDTNDTYDEDTYDKDGNKIRRLPQQILLEWLYNISNNYCARGYGS